MKTKEFETAFENLADDVCKNFRDKILNFKNELIQDLAAHDSESFGINNNLMQDMFKNKVKKCDIMSSTKSSPTITETRSKESLKDKEFVARASLLTEMLEVNHIKTIYNIFVAILIVFSLNTIVFDLIEREKFIWDFDLITYSLGQFPYVIVLWCVIKIASVIILFPCYRLYALLITSCIQDKITKKENLIEDEPINISFNNGLRNRKNASENSPSEGDSLFQAEGIDARNNPSLHSFFKRLINLRLIMKTHSFVHENVAKIRTVQQAIERGSDVGSEELKGLIPNFSQYLYFLFAPTLIYRDTYPRTSVIHWDYVVSNLLQVLTCLFYTYYIFVRFCIPVFKHFNQDHLTPKTLILSVFGSMLPGTMVLVIAFFGVLHSWLNAFAEMLRFADRMFYKDWWNSNSFTNYYRTWNVVVHDWLYLYVYKDFFGNKISRPLSMLIVFQISALAHEMVIAVAFRFFYPVLLILFGILGFGAMFITSKGVTRGWNILLWVMMFAGNGLLMTLYSMEWYARKNCPSHVDSKVADFFIPRSWYCHHKADDHVHIH